MSTYVREKVLRIPLKKLFDEYLISGWLTINNTDDVSEVLEKNFPNEFKHATVGKFQIAPTEENYIDFVLEYNQNSYCGEFGKIRNLYNTEKENFLPIFQRLISILTLEDMNAVKVVEFCWYNNCEAPNFYDTEDDDFYKEITTEDIR